MPASWPPPGLDAVAALAERERWEEEGEGERSPVPKEQPQEPSRGREEEWAALAEAAQAADFGRAVQCLARGLEEQDPQQLLQLLRGSLQEVVRLQEEAEGRAKERREQAGSAFQRFAGPGTEPEGQDGAAAELPAARRWRRTLRTLFDADAAEAMLSELRMLYAGDDFAAAAEYLDAGWPRQESVHYAEQVNEVDRLCLRVVLGPVLQRYGFSPDLKGSKEVHNIITDLASKNKQLRDRQREVQGLIFSYFPNLGCNG